MSAVCVGTLFHQCWWVAPGGVPKSSVCAEALLNGWIVPFGAPKMITCDKGVHNQGRLKDLLRTHGILLRYTGVEAPFQLGRGERQGSLFKDIIKASIEERQILGIQEMKALIAESCIVKNSKLHHQGFSPYQWVLGKLPLDDTSLTSEEADRFLEVHEEIMEPEDEFSMRLQIRQAAKVAFAKVDASRRVRAALLRKSVPLRGPYPPGSLVCFFRRNRWCGPARVIGREGKSTVWLVHGGIPVVAADTSLRPATSAEIFTKRLLELRPSRKRLREAMSDQVQPDVPFIDDYQNAQLHEDDEMQPGYVDLGGEPETPFEIPTAGAGPQTLPVIPEDEPTPVLPVLPERQESAQVEPETEVMPETPVTAPNGPNVTPLQRAMHQSLDAVDGVLRRITPPPGLHRDRSRSPLREGVNVPIPEEDESLLAFGALCEKHGMKSEETNDPVRHEEQRRFSCMLAKRFSKKKKSAGPHTEINFDKASEEMQGKILAKRAAEWNNWDQFTAVDVIPPEEVEQFKEENPEVEILPTRWVDTNKAEVGEEEKLKSRLVVRGDLEENDLRTDSPTASQLFLNLIIAFAACSGNALKAGDISAAFLQGAMISRLLAMTLPKGGIPGVRPGSLLRARKSVYGTRDAPRSTWFLEGIA